MNCCRWRRRRDGLSKMKNLLSFLASCKEEEEKVVTSETLEGKRNLLHKILSILFLFKMGRVIAPLFHTMCLPKTKNRSIFSRSSLFMPKKSPDSLAKNLLLSTLYTPAHLLAMHTTKSFSPRCRLSSTNSFLITDLRCYVLLSLSCMGLAAFHGKQTKNFTTSFARCQTEKNV